MWITVVLPFPLGDEQPEDPSLGDVQVDAVEDDPVAVRVCAGIGDLDCQSALVIVRAL
jgi:hypothetical protein